MSILVVTEEILIFVEIFKRTDFGQKFENLDFGQNLRKISILVNIHENLDYGQSWR